MLVSYLKMLRFRIPMVIILASLIMIAFSYLLSAKYVKQETFERVELNLRDRLYFLQSSFKLVINNGAAERAQPLLSSMMSEPDLLMVLYADAGGTIRISNQASSRGEDVFKLYSEIDRNHVNALTESRLIDSRLNEDAMYLDGIAPVCPQGLISHNPQCGFLYYKIDLQYHISNAEKLLLLEAIIFSMGMLLIAVALMFFLYLSITKRFNLLVDGLRRFGSEEHSHRIAMAGDDEVFQISRHVNELFAKIEHDEFELKKREQELDAIFNTVVDGIVIIDAQGLIRDCNPSVTKLLGYERDEMLGRNVNMLMPEPYATEHDQYLQNFMTTRVSRIIGKGREVEAQRKDGRVLPIELAVSEMMLDGKSMFAGVIRDVSEQKHMQSALVKANELLFKSNLQLKNTAKTDGLTGLANRRHFDYVLSEEINRAARHKSELSLLMCDVDFFKKFNDSYGHQVGDDCLREVGSLLAKSFKRSGELPARYGGEEFAVIIPGVAAEEVHKAAELLCQTLYEQNIPHNRSLVADRVTLSIGVASLTEGLSVDNRSLIKWADDALYQAKEQGRNRVVVFHNSQNPVPVSAD